MSLGLSCLCGGQEQMNPGGSGTLRQECSQPWGSVSQSFLPGNNNRPYTVTPPPVIVCYVILECNGNVIDMWSILPGLWSFKWSYKDWAKFWLVNKLRDMIGSECRLHQNLRLIIVSIFHNSRSRTSFWRNLKSTSILSMEKVAKVISELKSVSRLKIFRDTGHWLRNAHDCRSYSS